MLDLFRETWNILKMNKLRTFLTGMSMSWGIFILIVLLGTGNGLVNGIKNEYSLNTTNLVEIWPGYTSLNYHGLKKGRNIHIDDKDVNMIDSEFDEVTMIAPLLSKGGIKLNYGTNSMNAYVTGATMERFSVSDVDVIKGRMFNSIDMDRARKVILIDKRTEEVLFKGEESIGKMVVVGDITMTVIGVYDTGNLGQSGDEFIPLSTMRAIYPQQKDVDDIMLAIDGVENIEESDIFVDNLRGLLAKRHNFNPEDQTAIWVYNIFKEFSQTMKIYSGLNMFLWLIGLGTMISGIVGIANIMLVTVKERTKEFGIRKALGAKPSSIIALVLSESLFITVAFGYVGMFFGMGLLKLLAMILGSMPSEQFPFMDPSISWGIIIGATLIMIIVAMIAAYVPTKRAVSVKPVEALNYE